MGGRRRSKKGGRRSRKHTMKGGNGYGVVSGAEGVIAPGALAYVPNMTSTPDGKPYVPTGGRRRSRKSKKGGRRHRKSMKGGGSVAGVGYGFTGTGARGIADAIAYPSNLPPSGFPIPEGTR